jgi:hypothetical protein
MILFLVLDFTALYIVKAVFNIFPNIDALMIYSVLVYVALIVPIAYLWQWWKNRNPSPPKKELSIENEN